MMSHSPSRRILVTSALPYANGPIHLGHMVEYIQTDIWVRFQQMRGHECHYVCADDAHGTAIMLRAEKEGITAQALIDKSRTEHMRDFQGFLVNHHQYHSTHSPENQAYSYEIYQALKDKGYIITRSIEQLYDEEKALFLPDRFVKGECPKCHAKDQYGDNCEVCGSTYDAHDLINPYSVVSGKAPITKASEHYFFDLPQFEGFLQHWLQSALIQESMRNKLAEWFVSGLAAWDISRDAPYWGFKIPETEDKYFYVWLDAPVGYMASFKALCAEKNLNFDDFWQQNSETELYHFIGKDIAYFHMLFWPAMLKGAGYRLPSGVFCHGFLTVNGEKMSKSRGTFIKAETYLKHLRPEYLRYYFASRLSSRVEDLDLNLEDFRAKANSDLVGKLVNLASRLAPFISKHFDGKLADKLEDDTLFQTFARQSEIIAQAYEQREFGQAVREIMTLADAANAYIDEQKPWAKIKDPEQVASVQQIATVGLNAFRQLIIYLQPILPKIAEEVAQFLNVHHFSWENAQSALLNHTINPYQPLISRIEEKQTQALIHDSLEDLKQEQKTMTTETKPTAETQADTATISIDDFAKLDIRVAKVLHCEKVEGSDKLLKFQLDVGDLGQRQVFSGIAKYHQPEELVGTLVLLLANLAPRKMRFGMSEGMILSASNEETLQLLQASGRAVAGMKVS
ncbi:MAG: methionine--tRNA ligase [Cardiobacteriaceae bacterium]|nr:methionine--tRNA ligase [Cardiobacteriaceae bacterium]